MGPATRTTAVICIPAVLPSHALALVATPTATTLVVLALGASALATPALAALVLHVPVATLAVPGAPRRVVLEHSGMPSPAAPSGPAGAAGAAGAAWPSAP